MEETGNTADRPRRRAGRILVWTTVAALTLLAGLTAFLVTTEAGLRLVVSGMQRGWPGLLSVARSEGSLVGGVRLSDVRVVTEGARVEFSSLALDWLPRRLLAGEFKVTALVAQNVQVALQEVSDTEERAVRLPALNLPLSLALDRVTVEELRVSRADQRLADLSRVTLRAHWRGARLHVENLDIVSADPVLHADLGGHLSFRDSWPLDLSVRWRFEDSAAPLSGSGQLRGDVGELQFVHDSAGSLVSRLDATVRGLPNDLHWQGRLNIQDSRPRAFSPDIPEGRLKGELRFVGEPGMSSVEGSLRAGFPEGAEVPPLTAELKISLGNHRIRLDELRLTAAEATVEATGRIPLTALRGDPAGEDMELELNWERLAWPLAGEPVVRSPEGRLVLGGGIDGFEHRLRASLSAPDFPPTHVTARGTGQRSGIRFSQLEFDLLGGILAGRGELDWQEGVTWDVSLDARGLEPQRHWPQVEAELAGRLHASGRAGAELEAAFSLDNINGHIQGRPVSGGARLALEGTGIRIEDLDLAVGANRVRAVGLAGESLDLSFEVVAPEMAVLWPGSSGSLELSGTAAGSVARPRVDAKIEARDLRVAGLRLQSAAGSAQLVPGEAGRVQVDLGVQGLEWQGYRWERLRLKAAGPLDDHALDLELNGEPLSLVAAAGGDWRQDGAYELRLRESHLKAWGGEWRLERPVVIRLGETQWGVDGLCLQGGPESGGGCLSVQHTGPGSTQLEARLSGLSLQLFGPLLGEDVTFEGVLEGEARLATAQGILTGEARLQIPQGRAVSDFIDEEEQPLDFSGAEVRLAADAAALRADLRVPFRELGMVRGELSLPEWRMDAPLHAEQAVSGKATGGIDNLQPLGLLVPQLDAIKGRIGLDMALAGTLGNLGVKGGVQLEDAGFEVSQLGVTVTDLDVNATADRTDHVRYTGRVQVGEGTAQVTGESRLLGDEGWLTHLELKAKNLRVADLPEATVDVSPDLVLEVGRGEARINGDIRVPFARLRPRQLPSGSVSASADVVVAGREDQEQGMRLATAADVRIRLGKRVSFDGFGLRGQLRGDLTIRQEPGRLTRGDGQVNIQDGVYTVQGEALTIDRGRLVFANTPVQNPAIDLTASRVAGNATVGVRVSGTLNRPSLEFFSDPPMGQAEALNLLITGGSSGGGSLTGSAIVGGGNLLVREMGRRVGLDDIGLTSGEGADEMALYIGTYLRPDLYMQYVSELGARANKIRLRYDLTSRIQVQVETGDIQGMDVFYTFER